MYDFTTLLNREVCRSITISSNDNLSSFVNFMFIYLDINKAWAFMELKHYFFTSSDMDWVYNENE